MKRWIALPLLLVPAIVFALDYTDATGRYTDESQFSRGDSVAISVLTNLGAVSGNPDGSFAPNRTVNRAEFLKMMFASHPTIVAIDNDSADCFPDVQADDWFSKYVCLAKERGAVQGYPDGNFRPGQAVNYVEAIKMLAESYSVSPLICEGENAFSGCVSYAPYPPGTPWYEPYYNAAKTSGVLLEEDIPLDTPLTRAQVSRLAVAYRAYAEGELSLFRSYERGEVPWPPSASSTSSLGSSQSSLSSLSSASSLPSSSSSSSVTAAYPAVSRFLIAGETTPVIYDGIFMPTEEDVEIRSIVIETRRVIDSISYFELVDDVGNPIVDIPFQTYNNSSDLLWRVDINAGEGYVLQKLVGKRLGIRAKLKANGNGAVSSELVELRTITMYANGTTTSSSYQLVPSDTHNPSHQTAFGRITSLQNTAGASLTVPQGNGKLLGTFTVNAQKTGSAAMKVFSLAFTVETTDVNVAHLSIGGATEAVRADCGLDNLNGATVATCTIPESMQDLSSGSTTVSVYGDVTVNVSKQTGTFRLAATGPGTLGTIGGISWYDGANTFNWVDPTTTVGNGPMVTVTK